MMLLADVLWLIVLFKHPIQGHSLIGNMTSVFSSIQTDPWPHPASLSSVYCGFSSVFGSFLTNSLWPLDPKRAIYLSLVYKRFLSPVTVLGLLVQWSQVTFDHWLSFCHFDYSLIHLNGVQFLPCHSGFRCIWDCFSWADYYFLYFNFLIKVCSLLDILFHSDFHRDSSMFNICCRHS